MPRCPKSPPLLNFMIITNALGACLLFLILPSNQAPWNNSPNHPTVAAVVLLTQRLKTLWFGREIAPLKAANDRYVYFYLVFAG